MGRQSCHENLNRFRKVSGENYRGVVEWQTHRELESWWYENFTRGVDSRPSKGELLDTTLPVRILPPRLTALIAQQVEQRLCNPQVIGSIPVEGSKENHDIS